MGKAELRRGAVRGTAILPYSPGAEPRGEGPSNDVGGVGRSWTLLQGIRGYPMNLAQAALNHRPKEMLLQKMWLQGAAWAAGCCGMLLPTSSLPGGELPCSGRHCPMLGGWDALATGMQSFPLMARAGACRQPAACVGSTASALRLQSARSAQSSHY